MDREWTGLFGWKKVGRGEVVEVMRGLARGWCFRMLILSSDLSQVP